jgi:DNA modification methylase
MEEDDWGSIKPIETPPKKGVNPKNKINDLDGSEWIQLSKSFFFQKGLGKDHKEAQIEKQHPAPFSYQDIQNLIKMFTKKGMTVLDPFSGVASTLKAAALLERNGIGIELSEKWADLGRKRLESEVPGNVLCKTKQEIIQGDCRDVLKSMANESVHYIVTSPPYWGILNKKADHKTKAERISNGYDTRYSTDEKDLANIDDYKVFLTQLGEIIQESRRVLAQDRYFSIIVSDFRNKSEFIPYHKDVIDLFHDAGYKIEGITVLLQNHKRLFPYGYPYAFVQNIHHQYILTFKRPIDV